MANPVGLGSTIYLYFGTSSASTGAATNADSTPTVTVAQNGTDLGYAPTVTNVTTGLYKVAIACTAGNGFSAGNRYSAYVVATVGGVTGRDGISEWEVLAVDANTGVASVQGNVTGSVASVTGAVGSVTGLTVANLDVAVSTRMATFATPTNFAAMAITAGGTVTAALDTADATKLDEMYERDGLKVGAPALITPTGLTSLAITQTYATVGTDTTVTRV